MDFDEQFGSGLFDIGPSVIFVSGSVEASFVHVERHANGPEEDQSKEKLFFESNFIQ